jgi:hypothetical protein
MSLAEQFQARRQQEESTQKLFKAVSLNKVAKVKELLRKGADPNVLDMAERKATASTMQTTFNPELSDNDENT